MDDNVNNDQGQQDQGGQPQGTPPPAAIVGADGKFRENWREALPEDIRGEKVFERAKDWEGLMRTTASAQRMVGMDKIAIPNAESGDDVWDAYYRAGGRPETAAEYNIQRPEQFPEDHWSDERANAFGEIFHKIGLNKKQVDTILAAYHEDLGRQITGRQDAERLELEKLQGDLTAKWGNQFESKKHQGNLAIERGAEDAEHKQRLVEKYGNDPDFILFASNLGAKYMEASGYKPQGAPTMSTSEIDAKISEVMSGEAFMQRNHPQHKLAIERVSQLHKDKAALAGQPG